MEETLSDRVGAPHASVPSRFKGFLLESAAAALPGLRRSMPGVAHRCELHGVADIFCCHLALTGSRESGECWRGRVVSARVHVNARRIVAPAHLRGRGVPRAGTGGAEQQESSRLQTVDGILSVRAVHTAAACAHRRAVSSSGLMTPSPIRRPIRPTVRPRSARAKNRGPRGPRTLRCEALSRIEGGH